jgi:thiol-disulfide isomerase/thioredoxin
VLKVVRVLLILVLIIGVVYAVYQETENNIDVVNYANCKGTPGVEVQNCAPNFSLKTMTGQKIELYQTKGKPTIINFWASWCDPCKQEMPYLEAAYQKYKDQVNFLMINQTAQDNLPNIKAFMQQYRFTFPVILDPAEDGGETIGADRYQLVGIPTTIVIDSTGKITHKVVGEMSEEELQVILNDVVS